MLNSLFRGLKSHKTGGRVAAISKEEQQRILRDVLIARTAKRENVAIVTDNRSDFEKIRNFCNVKLIMPEDFFS